MKRIFHQFVIFTGAMSLVAVCDNLLIDSSQSNESSEDIAATAFRSEYDGPPLITFKANIPIDIAATSQIKSPVISMAGIPSPKDTLLAKLIHTTTKLNYCLMQLTLIALLNINMRLCWKTKLIKPRGQF